MWGRDIDTRGRYILCSTSIGLNKQGLFASLQSGGYSTQMQGEQLCVQLPLKKGANI